MAKKDVMPDSRSLFTICSIFLLFAEVFLALILKYVSPFESPIFLYVNYVLSNRYSIVPVHYTLICIPLFILLVFVYVNKEIFPSSEERMQWVRREWQLVRPLLIDVAEVIVSSLLNDVVLVASAILTEREGSENHSGSEHSEVGEALTESVDDEIQSSPDLFIEYKNLDEVTGSVNNLLREYESHNEDGEEEFNVLSTDTFKKQYEYGADLIDLSKGYKYYEAGEEDTASSGALTIEYLQNPELEISRSDDDDELAASTAPIECQLIVSNTEIGYKNVDSTALMEMEYQNLSTTAMMEYQSEETEIFESEDTNHVSTGEARDEPYEKTPSVKAERVANELLRATKDLVRIAEFFISNSETTKQRCGSGFGASLLELRLKITSLLNKDEKINFKGRLLSVAEQTSSLVGRLNNLIETTSDCEGAIHLINLNFMLLNDFLEYVEWLRMENLTIHANLQSIIRKALHALETILRMAENHDWSLKLSGLWKAA